MVVRLCCFVQPFKIFAKLVLFGVDFIKLPFIFEAEHLNIVIFNNCFQFHCPNCNLHLSKKLLFAPPMSKLTVVVCSVPAAPQVRTDARTRLATTIAPLAVPQANCSSVQRPRCTSSWEPTRGRVSLLQHRTSYAPQKRKCRNVPPSAAKCR